MGEASNSSGDGSLLGGLQLGEVGQRGFRECRALGAGGTPGLPPLRHKGRPRFQFIQFNRCETRYISFGVMDASITEDKCECINTRRHGRNQTETTGWVLSPPGCLGCCHGLLPAPISHGRAVPWTQGLQEGWGRGRDWRLKRKNQPQKLQKNPQSGVER